MENSSRVMLMMSVMVLGMLSLWPMVVMGKPVLHKVGGSKGWNQNVNYTIWSSQQHVYVDDWLSKSLNIYFFSKLCFISSYQILPLSNTTNIVG
jgi:hypothetical protein